jgi:hypothetical protein
MHPGRGAGPDPPRWLHTDLAMHARSCYTDAMTNLGPIHTYRSEVDQIIRFGGSTRETTIREPEEVREFKKAVETFKGDIPTIAATLRTMIVGEGKRNAAFRTRRGAFLDLCRTAINPAVTPDDVDEMFIQHILTEEIFISIFSDTASCACAN